MSHYEDFAKDKDNHDLLQQERLKIEIAALIYQRMKVAGVSRKDLASKLGVTKGRISQILCGQRNMTLATVADIFSALGDRLIFSSEREVQERFQVIEDMRRVVPAASRPRLRFPMMQEVCDSQTYNLAG